MFYNLQYQLHLWHKIVYNLTKKIFTFFPVGGWVSLAAIEKIKKVVDIEKALVTDVRFVKGVGEKKAKVLNSMGIFTVDDLLNLYPKDYEDRTKIVSIREVSDGETVCVCGSVINDPTVIRARSGLTICKFQIADKTGVLNLTYFNQPYIKTSIKAGAEYIFYGKVSANLLYKEMQNPIFEKVDKTDGYMGRIVPRYPLKAGITQRILRDAVCNALTLYADLLEDCLPQAVRTENALVSVNEAYKNIHFPKSFEKLEAAKRRLVFEELIILQLSLFKLKENRKVLEAVPMLKGNPADFLSRLPFELTTAQKRTLDECVSDLRKSLPANRLIQGDVGSGKTVVAAACGYIASKNGAQSVIMAPTEILARQHFEGLHPIFEKLGISCELLIGGMTKSAKDKTKKRIAEGETQIVIATHAVLTPDVVFSNLNLVICDEQHRFGVKQRERLGALGENPHFILMSATPIPRTLALIIYGDLDISIIDELPPGRKKVLTYVVTEEKRSDMYRFMREQVEGGRQGYIVCPQVEENEGNDLKAVKIFTEELKNGELSGVEIAYIHGKMKTAEKQTVMRNFMANKIKILVSTTVIEVGVNVPNAVIMIIENAERFGLSQLHQLRGRVGRGSDKSYCFMLPEKSSEKASARLDIMCKTNDGFKIAEEDLKLRGAGDFFGSRQHGSIEFKIANIATDYIALRDAQLQAAKIIEADGELKMPENQPLKKRVEKLLGTNMTGQYN